jgi:ABC-type antimicrobial peptide transport system permease subunit
LKLKARYSIFKLKSGETMHWLDFIRVSLHPFRTRRFESVLIVVVIAVGVSVITSNLALIFNGIEQENKLKESIESRELVMVTPSNDFRSYFTPSGVNPVIKIGNNNQLPVKLGLDDLNAALEACPAIQYAYLADRDRIYEPASNGTIVQSNEIQILAVTQPYIRAAKLTLLAGSWPNFSEFKTRQRVVALSDWYARKRFGKSKDMQIESVETEKPVIKPNKNPSVLQNPTTGNSANDSTFLRNIIGKSISSELGTKYKIIAIFATPDQGFENDYRSFGARGIMPWGINDFIQLDVTELKFLPRDGQTDAAREQLRMYTNRRFNNTVVVNAARDRIAASLDSSRNSALITAMFASGGLMIAALNITNLMLARVLGRTRRIGISSALGASSRTIFSLFLTESLALGLLGGLLGLAMAYGLTNGLESTLNHTNALSSENPFKITRINLTLHPLHLTIGFLIAVGASILFGAYPAWIASRVRPSEAIRG